MTDDIESAIPEISAGAKVTRESVLDDVEKGTPEGVPDNAEYVPPEEVDDVPSEELIQTDDGGHYRVQGDSGGNNSDDDTVSGEFGVEEGDAYREISSPEDAAQALAEFDEIEAGYEYDYWEGQQTVEDADLVEGTYIEYQTDAFQLQGDGKMAVVADVTEDGVAVVTEDGEEKVLSDYGEPSQRGENEVPLMGVFDDAINQAVTGDRDLDSWDEDYLPEQHAEIVSEVSDDGEEESEDEPSLPRWADEEGALASVEASEPPEGGLDDGKLIEYDGEMVEAVEVETEGDLPVYEVESDNLSLDVSTVDGVLTSFDSNRIPFDSSNYLEFDDESGLEDGWYQVGEELVEMEDGDLAYEIVDEEGNVEKLPASEVEGRDTSVVGVHTPVENTVNIDSSDFDSIPEPSGSRDISDWGVSWGEFEDEQRGTDTPRLNDVEKKKLMREWEAAVGEETAESVRETIMDVKRGTYSTEGQKYDKFAKAVSGSDGEVREGPFDDAEDPTEEEIAAMELLQEASQEVFEEAFGEERTTSRALADYSHENMFPVLEEMYGDDIGEDNIQLEDNPASVWSTDEKAARTFTLGEMDDSETEDGPASEKALMIQDSISSDEVFNMPDAVMPYKDYQDDSGGAEKKDWDEGEVNIDGNRTIDPNNVKAVGSASDGFYEASVVDVLESPEEVAREEHPEVVAQFIRAMGDYASPEFIEQFVEDMLDESDILEVDSEDDIRDAIEYDTGIDLDSVVENSMDPDNSPEDAIARSALHAITKAGEEDEVGEDEKGSVGESHVVDVRSEEDADWLRSVEM